ncbi:hypothetical protein CH278_26855 [Rhodococcus sp. 05-2254-5]|uniref:UvrD-helicase domain-containing protein n=1 Tax=unclassified Rhodococcus (in: high G+C Gram-positive bacteria) TaxID=192944 RepID=UPI000B9AD8F5|nr:MULTISPECIES: UvrD-helicase domain-containing protein [unclassified Rhodococcus (in: high G+C Gram-positive bacteria)]OZE26717.1 hypothetical protein CH278_26855 [Rhodococcus sp. 05-2254-5]OZE52697.1 hypothetical protein CH269_22745 [Rhodococcus sp. 05-2254-1]
MSLGWAQLMLKLTDAQVVAAAAQERLVNVVSAPGSGKTTVAAERYGFQRYQPGDLRGVLGISFNRAAAAELRARVAARWGSGCVSPPHRIMTFDHLHVALLEALIAAGQVEMPGAHQTLDVRDDYRGFKGFRYLRPPGNYLRVAGIDSNRLVVSKGRKVETPTTGIGNLAHHRAVLATGTVSHEDVRHILLEALKLDEPHEFASQWIASNFRAVIVDEVYDASLLDIYVAYLAAESGLSVTVIGDPWQALYKWRGAQPEIVTQLIEGTTDRFVAYEQPESFRFVGDQMPLLASDLRAGMPVVVPKVSSFEIDVALARNWNPLWFAGDNILPLAFRTVENATDAALNLLLDQVTRMLLGVSSHGREGAIAKLGLDRELFNAKQDSVLQPIVSELLNRTPRDQMLEALRDAIRTLGVRRPGRLPNASREAECVAQLTRLGDRLAQPRVIPGLTVFQAKGREWDRVGVALTATQEALLADGLRELDDEHCVIYVALTRARALTGLLGGTVD